MQNLVYNAGKFNNSDMFIISIVINGDHILL